MCKSIVKLKLTFYFNVYSYIYSLCIHIYPINVVQIKGIDKHPLLSYPSFIGYGLIMVICLTWVILMDGEYTANTLFSTTTGLFARHISEWMSEWHRNPLASTSWIWPSPEWIFEHHPISNCYWMDKRSRCWMRLIEHM